MAYSEHAAENYKSMINISIEAMKSLLLVNGGAVIAILSYLSAIKEPNLATNAKMPLGFFVTGVVLSVLTFVFSYLTQYALFNEEVRALEYKGQKHQTYLKIAFVFLIICLLSFIGGCISSICLFTAHKI